MQFILHPKHPHLSLGMYHTYIIHYSKPPPPQNGKHPFIMVFFLIITSITFSLFGFIIGIWADNFEKLQLIPILIITPLVFLGGSFYSIDMLPEFWQKVSLLNPVLYLVSGFRWSFFEVADVSLITSLTTVFIILIGSITAIVITFVTGFKIKN